MTCGGNDEGSTTMTSGTVRAAAAWRSAARMSAGVTTRPVTPGSTTKVPSRNSSRAGEASRTRTTSMPSANCCATTSSQVTMASMFWSPKKEAAQAMGEAPVWPAARAASTLASTSSLKPSWVAVAGIVPAGVSSGRSRAANPIASFSTSLRISSSESPPTSTSPISTFGTDRPERTTTSAM